MEFSFLLQFVFRVWLKTNWGWKNCFEILHCKSQHPASEYFHFLPVVLLKITKFATIMLLLKSNWRNQNQDPFIWWEFGRNMFDFAQPVTWFLVQKQQRQQQLHNSIRLWIRSDCATESHWTWSQWNYLLVLQQLKQGCFSFLKTLNTPLSINGWKYE